MDKHREEGDCEKCSCPSNKERYYVPVSPFGITTFIRALKNDRCVTNIAVSTEDNGLLVSYDYEPQY